MIEPVEGGIYQVDLLCCEGTNGFTAKALGKFMLLEIGLKEIDDI